METIARKEDIIAAASACGAALEGRLTFAVVGGAACVLLGSARDTRDVDVVVTKGNTIAAKNALRASGDFILEPRTRHISFNCASPVEVDVLTPPIMFRENFDDTTPTLYLESFGVRVLMPALILNGKCASILTRPDERKKDNDAADILFLLRWSCQEGQYPRAEQVPNASLSFVKYFCNNYNVTQEVWIDAGYDFSIGAFRDMH